MASVRVVYLGRLADAAGRAESEFPLSGEGIGWADLIALLEQQVAEGLGEAVLDERVKLAVNGKLLPDKEALRAHPGDEIALLPPVSGG